MKNKIGEVMAFCNEFYLAVLPFSEGNRKYWMAKVSNKRKKTVKEFLGLNRDFTELKALEWIKNKNHWNF